MQKLHFLLTEGPKLTYCNFNIIERTIKQQKSHEIACSFSIQVQRDDESNEVAILFSVKSESDTIPFSFDIGAKASFKCNKKCPSDEDAIIETTPYIFPFLKELVADLTRKAYLSPFYLPSIELQIDKFQKAEKAKAEKAKENKPIKA
jgi:preprotein translocase subunit SecB